MSGVTEGISCVCYPACCHSQAFLILEIIGVGLFLLSFILAYNSWSYLEKYGSLLAWMDGLCSVESKDRGVLQATNLSCAKFIDMSTQL